MNIIYVEHDISDAEKFRSEIAGYLSAGYVHIFADEQRAVECMYQHHFDVAFLDIHIPEMDGIALAKRFQLIQPDIKIAFITEDPSYALEAYEFPAVAYILKPYEKSRITREIAKIQKQFPVLEKCHVYLQTMPRFEIFVDGKLLPVSKRKVKELLALLVDFRGSSVSNRQAIARLWEERPEDNSTKALFRMTAKRLKDFLVEEQLDDILIKRNGVWAIDTRKVVCDYYNLLNGDKEAIRHYHGAYMSEYSWAEETNARLYALVYGQGQGSA